MPDKEYFREWRKKNRELLNAKAAEYRETHREELRKYNREYARIRRAKEKEKSNG